MTPKRETFEELNSRVNHRLRKEMRSREQGQETAGCCNQVNRKKLIYEHKG